MVAVPDDRTLLLGLERRVEDLETLSREDCRESINDLASDINTLRDDLGMMNSCMCDEDEIPALESRMDALVKNQDLALEQMRQEIRAVVRRLDDQAKPAAAPVSLPPSRVYALANQAMETRRVISQHIDTCKQCRVQPGPLCNEYTHYSNLYLHEYDEWLAARGKP